MLPGPFCTQILADFGADVIKIEDVAHGYPFRATEPKMGGVAVRHLTLNRNKRSLSLDLKSLQGKEIFLQLLDSSQVVVEQFRPGVMDRLGLGAETLRARNSRLVYCSLSGFGQNGPWRNLVAHDPNFLALAGVLDLIGAKSGPPAMSGLTIADITGALMAAIGILLGVRNSEKNGVGEYIDLSMFDGAVAAAVTAASTYLGSGRGPARGSERHTGGVPASGLYETADARHVVICAIEQHFWANLCGALGREDWLPHAFASGDKAADIQRELAAIFRTRTRDAWFEELGAAGTCLAPVLSIGETLQSEHAKARGLVVAHDHPDAGATRILANPIRLRDNPAKVRFGAPALGEHSDEIMRDLGYSRDDIAALAALNAIRIAPPREASLGDGGREASCASSP
jgi:crotonobetainyl-CoA:carnitine CoA-transferase CaiB-like acyl-CoA transferase